MPVTKRQQGEPIGGGWVLEWPRERARNPFWQAQPIEDRNASVTFAALQELRDAMHKVFEDCEPCR